MVRKGILAGLIIILMISCKPQQIRIDIMFDQINGLAGQDRVLFQGNQAGRVTDVRYNTDGRYTVQVAIDKGFANAVTQYSLFEIVDDPDHDDHKAVAIRITRTGGAPLASGTTVQGESIGTDLGRRLQEDLRDGFSFFKEQIDKFTRDMEKYPESEEYQRLKKSLDDLAAEIGNKEKEVRERIKREWLPRIQRELDDLRERLKRSGREEELKPLDREVDRIRRI